MNEEKKEQEQEQESISAWFDARIALRTELKRLQAMYNFTPLELISIALQETSELVVSAVKDERSE